MKTLYTAVLLISAINIFPAAAFSQDGSLNLSFGTGGMVTTDFENTKDFGRAAVIQSDGKILVAGWSDDNIDADFAVARYNSDGTLDNTFGSGGKATTAIGDFNE